MEDDKCSQLARMQRQAEHCRLLLVHLLASKLFQHVHIWIQIDPVEHSGMSSDSGVTFFGSWSHCHAKPSVQLYCHPHGHGMMACFRHETSHVDFL